MKLTTKRLIIMFLIMVFAFWGIECLLYILMIKESKLFIPCDILFIAMVTLFIQKFIKFDLPHKIIAPIIVLGAVFAALGILKVTIPLLTV